MVMAGTLDAPTRLETVLNIFVEDAGDYYEISNGLLRMTGGDHDVVVPKA